MSGYGVPGVPGRSGGTDPESTRLDEKELQAAAERHEAEQKARAAEKQRDPRFFSRLFKRRSSH